jgi:hypothetical protein
MEDGRLVNAAAALNTGEEKGVIRMDLDGTRASSATSVDKSFRFRVTRVLIGVGIPLNTLTVICPALEDMRQKPLAGSKQVASQHIVTILEQEVDAGQLKELEGKNVALCFNATPRTGDAFPLIVHCVETTADGMCKRCVM